MLDRKDSSVPLAHTSRRFSKPSALSMNKTNEILFFNFLSFSIDWTVWVIYNYISNETKKHFSKVCYACSFQAHWLTLNLNLMLENILTDRSLKSKSCKSLLLTVGRWYGCRKFQWKVLVKSTYFLENTEVFSVLGFKEALCIVSPWTWLVILSLYLSTYLHVHGYKRSTVL